MKTICLGNWIADFRVKLMNINVFNHGFPGIYVPWSKVAILGMGDLQPLMGNPYNGAL